MDSDKLIEALEEEAQRHPEVWLYRDTIKRIKEQADENASLRAQLAAAVEDLDAVIKIACEHGVGVCDYCAVDGEECHGDEPKWRGPQEVGKVEHD